MLAELAGLAGNIIGGGSGGASAPAPAAPITFGAVSYGNSTNTKGITWPMVALIAAGGALALYLLARLLKK